jgi:predicted Zn-ribbon and HTH transcriptional regulator
MERRFCVYFICEQPFTDRVKIGKTTDVTSRIKSLQTGNPSKLSLLKVIYVDDSMRMTKLETQIHKDLVNRRLIGEWFKLSLAEVDQVYARYFNTVGGTSDNRAAIEEDNIDDMDVDTDDVDNDSNHITVKVNEVTVDIVINNKKCNDCGKEFRDSHNFNQHKNRKTPCMVRELSQEQMNDPNRCIYCNKVFVKKSNLLRHLNTCKIKK